MRTIRTEVGDPIGVASILSARLQDYLAPLLLRLDQALDRRLVKTFAATMPIVLEQRYRQRACCSARWEPPSAASRTLLQAPIA